MLALNYMLTCNSKNFMTHNVLHRWRVFNGVNYMNCEEKIKNCNSIMFEDYSLSKKIIIKEKEEPKEEEEDVGMIAVTYYHF